MSNQRDRYDGADGGELDEVAGTIAPGKVPLTAGLGRGGAAAGAALRGAVSWLSQPVGPAVQARAVADGGGGGGGGGGNGAVGSRGAATADDPFAIHLVAERGVAGATAGLPHGDVIQASFGHHDVSEVRAAVGGAAAGSAAALGARAYATGDRIGFAAAPDPWLAAHEAAHVVQQRAGVRLHGGLGRAGDVYERHADAVADRVVRGQSAEALLDEMAHRGAGGGPAIQRDPPEGGEGGGEVDGETGLPAPPAEVAPGHPLVDELGGDPELVRQVEETRPAALDQIYKLVTGRGITSPQVVDALLGIVLGADPASAAAALGGGPWLELWLGAVADMDVNLGRVVDLLEAEQGGVEGMAAAPVCDAILGERGGPDLVALRAGAVDAVRTGGRLTPAALLTIDRMLLSGDAPAAVARAGELTRTIQTETEQLGADLAARFAALSSPPTYAEMEAIDALLTAFDARVAAWRVELRELEDPALRWLLAAAAREVGADWDASLTALRGQFEDGVAAAYGGADQFNATEMERERVQATDPSAPQLREGTANGPFTDQDWIPFHVPGTTIRRHPLAHGTISGADARGPGDVSAVVVHTGGPTEDNTIDHLDGEGLEGHYVVDQGGDLAQMHPTSQAGVHAGMANPSSVGIDLTHQSNSDEDTVAYLNNLRQLIATVQLMQAHRRVSPIGDETHHRGQILDDNVGDVRRVNHGVWGHQVTWNSGSTVGDDLSGIVAHQDLPSEGHTDPGLIYMQRLYAMVPLLEEYERRYGPIEVDDPAELERVVAVFEAYEDATGRPAGAISEREVRRRLRELLIGRLDRRVSRVSRELLEEIVDDDVVAGMIGWGGGGDGDALLGDDFEARVTARLDEAGIRHPERRAATIVEVLGDREQLDDDLYRIGGDLLEELAVDHLGGRAAYNQEVADARNSLPSSGTATSDDRDRTAGVMVEGQAYTEVLDASLAAFRAYLEEHLADLIE